MKIIKEHLRRYPAMQLQDLVKLVFQRTFGPEHMITNVDKSLVLLKKELAGVEFDPNAELAEDIGEQFVRIRLTAAKNLISAEKLNEIFVLSAQKRQNAVQDFEKTFELIKSDSSLPFPINEIDEYLEAYRAANYPAISHSDVYKREYEPHYRVVNKKFLNDI